MTLAFNRISLKKKKHKTPKNILMENRRLLLPVWVNLMVSQTGLASPFFSPWEGVHVNML